MGEGRLAMELWAPSCQPPPTSSVAWWLSASLQGLRPPSLSP